MPANPRFEHPLSAWGFYTECFRYAFTGAWGVLGNISTGLPLAVVVFKLVSPLKYGAIAGYLKSLNFVREFLALSGWSGSDVLILGVPMTIGILLLTGRLLAAPFLIYKDNLIENANMSRPKIMLEWLNDALATPYAPVRVYNGGDSAAVDVEAVIQVGEYNTFRVGPVRLIAPRTDIFVTPTFDYGGPHPVASRDDARTCFRLALDWESPATSEYRKQRAQMHSITRMRSSEPPPDRTEPFSVTYRDFHGARYTTPHVLTYFDSTSTVHFRLATADDA